MNILWFLLYAWLAGNAVAMVACAILRWRTDEWDPIYRFYRGVINATLIQISVGLVIIILAK